MKTCTKCGGTKDIGEFSPGGKKVRHHPWCKQCKRDDARARRESDPERFAKATRKWRQQNPERARKSRLNAQRKFNYGVTAEDYAAMNEAQGFVCKICKQPETYQGRENLSVDHDHKTGDIRGLLCARCNLVLGKVQDDAELLYRMVDYLTGEGNGCCRKAAA